MQTSSSLSAFLASVSAISLSQKALCSASSWASLTSFSIISWIMPLTFAKGSALIMLRERMRMASCARAGTWAVSFGHLCLDGEAGGRGLIFQAMNLSTLLSRTDF